MTTTRSPTTAPDPVVLVCDPGSSSLRLVLAGPGDRVVASRHIEQPPGSPAAAAAVDAFLSEVVSRPVRAVGYRLVHGGPALTRPSLVDDEVLREVRAVADLAPLHLPPTLDLLDNLRRRLPDVPHVVCPDTAFHRGLPVVAATLALPAPWRDKYHLRRFGFHGLSYAWALQPNKNVNATTIPTMTVTRRAGVPGTARLTERPADQADRSRARRAGRDQSRRAGHRRARHSSDRVC